MNKTLYEILACPLCKGQVCLSKDKQELVCRPCGVAYSIRDGIPVMLEGEARTLSSDERLNEAP